MAGKPVGTIFVELDLDASRYTRSQQTLLKDATATSLNIEQNFKNLGIRSAAEMDLMRAKIKNSFDMIANNAKATANDIMRAEEAKNAKLKALDIQQFGAQTSIIEGIKKNWLAASAAVASAMYGIHKAMAYIEEGARAMQVESAFKIMAEAAEVNAEHLIASMKKATRETIDDSAMMQKAIKLMTLGYNPEQIERFSAVVITASQIAGTTAAEAYDELADAIGNRAPKALVRMGAVTREQMGIVNAAIEAGADSTVLFELAMSNLELKQKMLMGTQDQVAISLQRMKARSEETTEAIGKGLIVALDFAYRSFEYLAAGVMGLVSAYARYRELVYMVMGDEKQAAENRFVANVAWETRMDLLKRSTEAITDNAEAGKRATKEEIAGAREKVDAQLASLKATAEAGKKSKDEADKAEAVNNRFWGEYKKEVEGAFEFEKFKLEEQLREFDKYVHDKFALNIWYAAETRKIAIKEFADTAATQFPSESYGIESQRAKAYAANTKAVQAYTQSVEDQRAAMQKADKELSEQNWWKTYVEDIDDATRSNEIFKDSMNIMSQSAADAFAGFVTGTKSASEAFRSMVQSMIAALVRLASQRMAEQVFGSIVSGIGGLLGGSTAGPSTFLSSETMSGSFALVRHSGGAGNDPGPTRVVPSWLFDGADRYHSGIGPGERPAIIRDDEGVFTPGQMRALGAGAKGGGDTIHIYNITAMDSQSVEQALRRSGAVPALAAENYANNGIMRTVLRGTP